MEEPLNAQLLDRFGSPQYRKVLPSRPSAPLRRGCGAGGEVAGTPQLPTHAGVQRTHARTLQVPLIGKETN